MNNAEIFEFINANPICHLATVEGDAPRVRAMGLFKADARGIDVIKVFRTAQARACVWTRATNFDPKEYISL